MGNRIIKVIVTYDLDDPELKGMKITPREYVEQMVIREMIEVFLAGMKAIVA